MGSKGIYLILLGLLFGCTNVTYAQTTKDWYMPGANPQRTSWNDEEVKGPMGFLWYRPIEPYIPPNFQIVAAGGNVYMSTAKGLYAFNADNGNQVWVFPTELPLGQSPTYSGGVLYVGGTDHMLYAINATNGQKIWSFAGGGGFMTNPIVVNGLVILGNQDGYMYAVYDNNSPKKGTLAWKYKTGGSIRYSAAFANNKVYFASNDSLAYAVNVADGSEAWKSARLPGYGFYSWWPVVWGNYVVFSGAPATRQLSGPGPNTEWHDMNRIGVFGDKNSIRTQLGEKSGDKMDVSVALEYFETNPLRRTTFVLNQLNGAELTLDTNGNGKPEYAPFMWMGTKNGNRYPPAVAPDGLLYQSMMYKAMDGNQWQARGQALGWSVSDPTKMRIPTGWDFAYDEPLAYAGGGKYVHETLMGDRSAVGFDITNSSAGWQYWSYNLDRTDGNSGLLPGYNQMYWGTGMESGFGWVFGTRNGVYGLHGNQNPLIPYAGKIFTQRGNAIVAMKPGVSNTSSPLPKATIQTTSTSVPTTLQDLKNRLENEVKAVVDAGHLRAGYGMSGNADRLLYADFYLGDRMEDYFREPGDTLYSLSRALPFLSTDLQTRVKTYLQSEYTNYNPSTINHIGYSSGTAREDFVLLPEVMSGMAGSGKYNTGSWTGWGGVSPMTFYNLWYYAKVTGNAASIFTAVKDKLGNPPDNTVLLDRPYILNAWINGMMGYLELQKLAGQAETSTIRTKLNQLITLRKSNILKDAPYDDTTHNYYRSFNIARNFLYMTPELGKELSGIQAFKDAFNEYNWVAPYWFIGKFDATYAEGVFQTLYDQDAMFTAKAYVMNSTGEELVKYLDSPSMSRGDLFSINHLVIAIEQLSKTTSSSSPTISQSTPTPTLNPADGTENGVVDGLDYIVWLNNYGKNVTGRKNGNYNTNDSVVDGLDYIVWLNNYGR